MNSLAQFQPRNVALEQLKQAGFGPPQIRVAAGESKVCKQSIVKQGAFYLADSQPERCVSLGEWGPAVMGESKVGCHLKCILGPWRPHALLLEDGNVAAESFVQDSDEFQRIKNTKAVGQEVVPMFGTDILVFIPPDQINVGDLAAPERGLSPDDIASIKSSLAGGLVTTFFYAKTAKQYSPAGSVTAGEIIDISTGLIVTKKFSWWVPGGCVTLPRNTFSEELYNKGVQALMDASPDFIATTSNQVLEDVPPEGAVRRAR